MHWSHYSLIQFWASCISDDILPVFLHTHSIPLCTVQVGGAIRIKCTGKNIFFYGRNQRGCVEGNIFETAILFMTVSKGNRFDQLTVPVQPPSTPLPHPGRALTEERDFVAALARAGKSCKEIKTFVDTVYGDKTLP